MADKFRTGTYQWTSRRTKKILVLRYDDFYAYKKLWSNNECWIQQFANSYSSEY